MKLSDISNKAIRELLGTRSVSNTLINCQNGTATMDAVTIPGTKIMYIIDGQSFTLSDFTNKALATLAELQNPITGQDGYYDQPKSSTVYYTVVVNAAGTVYTIQGTYSGQVIARNGGAKAVRGDGSIPDVAVAGKYAVIAVLKVVNGVTAVFTPATTNWDATNVTSSALAVNMLPALDLTPAFIAGGA